MNLQQSESRAEDGVAWRQHVCGRMKLTVIPGGKSSAVEEEASVRKKPGGKEWQRKQLIDSVATKPLLHLQAAQIAVVAVSVLLAPVQRLVPESISLL